MSEPRTPFAITDPEWDAAWEGVRAALRAVAAAPQAGPALLVREGHFITRQEQAVTVHPFAVARLVLPCLPDGGLNWACIDYPPGPAEGVRQLVADHDLRCGCPAAGPVADEYRRISSRGTAEEEHGA